MKNVIIWIGSIVLSLIIIAIPVLLPISIIFKWNQLIIAILGFFTLSEFVLLATYIAMDMIES